MKKMKLLKNIAVVIMGIAIIFAFTNVLAADNDTYQDLSQAIAGNNSTGNNSAGTTTGNNSVTNNSGATNNSSTTGTNNGVFNTTGLTSNNSLANNASSNNSYSNTTLPKTGVESVAPIAILVVIFAVSAIYAYRKIKEYKNI